MSIPIKEGTTKRDWLKVTGAIAEVIFKSLPLGRSGFSSVVSPLFRILEALRGEDSTERRATRLILEVLTYSIAKTIQSVQFARPPLQAEIQSIAEHLLARIQAICEQSDVLLTSSDLEHPMSFQLFKDTAANIFHELKPNDPKASESEVVALFHRAIDEAMGRVQARSPAYFAPVFGVLASPTERLDAAKRAWDRYRELLIKRFEDEPLFGEDSATGLRLGQVYQSLRGYWMEADDEGNSAAQAKPKRYMRMLDSMVVDWLEKDDPQDRIRLISGGPGSGKSTFARHLASMLAVKPEWRVVFVPLQRLKGVGPLEMRINEYFRLQADEPFDEDSAPLTSLGRDGHRNWLVIFDGLDELAKEGPSSESAAQDFASALADWRSRVGGVSVRFLVLGRAPSMQEARRRLGLQGRGTLHVVGMAPLSKVRPSETRKLTFDDPHKLRDVDQRPEFWTRWAVARGEPLDLPEAMNADELADLTNEPLLAYLLILSGYVSERWREAAENRNRIYEAIFDHIWTRERDKLTRMHLNDLGQDCFESLLQALGIAAWRGGGRTGDEAVFVIVRDNFMRPDLLARARSGGASNLSNVALLFYTRKDEEGGRGYEFLHKSFGEYLTARGLFSAFQRWGAQVSDPTSDFDEAEFLRKWLRLTGPSRITREILTFLRNEVRLVSFNQNSRMPWKFARELLPAIEKIAAVAIKDGLPAHEGASRWKVAEAEEINGEIALFGLLDALSRAAYPSDLLFDDVANGGWRPGPILIEGLAERNVFPRIFRRLFDPTVTYGWISTGAIFAQISQSIVTSIFSRLSLDNAHLSGLELSSVDLEGASLKGAQLFGATFTQCNLVGVDMEAASLRYSKIVGCDLRKANFQNAELDQAQFDEHSAKLAGFRGAKLKKLIKSKLPKGERVVLLSAPS